MSTRTKHNNLCEVSMPVILYWVIILFLRLYDVS